MAVAAILAAGCGEPKGPDRPHIIVILIDTLRADHLGSGGHPGRISPRLDRLAAESIVFDRGYAQAPWTPPSMGTLFTSLYPETHGLHRFKKNQFLDPESGRLRATVLPEEAITLAEALRDAGYRTAGFVANPWLHGEWGLGQGFDHYDDSRTGNSIAAPGLISGAKRWLAEQPGDQPLFLYLHFMDVHGPYVAPESDFWPQWRLRVDDEPRVLTEEEQPGEHLGVHPSWAGEKLRQRLAYWQARYAAGVRVFDRRIAALLDEFAETGLLDEAWLVVTSDHGEELFEHGDWGHGKNLHDYQLRVPLIIRPPAAAGGGRRVGETARLIDLMPTLLSLAGADPPAGLQGTDLSPLLRAEAGGPAPVLFSSGVIAKPDMFAVQRGRYKLVVNGDASTLYDLENDPAETTDVSEREAALVAELSELLARHLEASSSESRLPTRTADIPEAMQEQLRVLGYIQ
jgi:arylsulfatase